MFEVVNTPQGGPLSSRPDRLSASCSWNRAGSITSSRQREMTINEMNAALLTSISTLGAGGLQLAIEDLSTASSTSAIRNMNAPVLPEIIPGVHIGSYKDACDLETVAEREIMAFLCVADNVSPPFPPFVSPADVDCGAAMTLHVKTSDNEKTVLSDYMSQVFAFVDEACEADMPVVIYCQKGISRSVSFLTAVVMRRLGIGFDDALNHIRKNYPRADPNFSFVTQLKELDLTRFPPPPHVQP